MHFYSNDLYELESEVEFELGQADAKLAYMKQRPETYPPNVIANMAFRVDLLREVLLLITSAYYDRNHRLNKYKPRP